MNHRELIALLGSTAAMYSGLRSVERCKLTAA